MTHFKLKKTKLDSAFTWELPGDGWCYLGLSHTNNLEPLDLIQVKSTGDMYQVQGIGERIWLTPLTNMANSSSTYQFLPETEGYRILTDSRPDYT